jgi:5-methylthioadenosine/S-adenosylhomocysteine deaminase
MIKGVLLDGTPQDIYIEGNRIKRIAQSIDMEADDVIDGSRKAVVPGFVNCHTHAAMTLFRGFGDDMPLMKWLHEKIWPNEAKLTEEDIYWGTKLAVLEMIKTGTTAFIDMYKKEEVTARVVREMGLRAMVSLACFDHFDEATREDTKKKLLSFVKDFDRSCDRVKPALGPHAVYTVSGELLQWIDGLSKDENLPIHIHVAETEDETRFCMERFGTTPIRYLNQLGVLSPRMIAAHVIYADDEEIRMLADNGVKVVHNPASNMKLGSGVEFKFVEMKNAGVTVGLGTDGCSSSNNLDMIEAMKLAALMGKGWRKDPEAIPDHEVLRAVTADGASIFGIDAGKIKEGALADLSLVDLRQPAFVPNHDFVSNLVYSANSGCVDTFVCDGKVLMRGREVFDEDKIMDEAERVAMDLIRR